MIDVLPVLGRLYFYGEGDLLEIYRVIAIRYLAGAGWVLKFLPVLGIIYFAADWHC